MFFYSLAIFTLFSLDINFAERTKVFQSILEFFPDNMKEPQGALTDAIKIF
jgi:hypothetical protein